MLLGASLRGAHWLRSVACRVLWYLVCFILFHTHAERHRHNSNAGNRKWVAWTYTLTFLDGGPACPFPVPEGLEEMSILPASCSPLSHAEHSSLVPSGLSKAHSEILARTSPVHGPGLLAPRIDTASFPYIFIHQPRTKEYPIPLTFKRGLSSIHSGSPSLTTRSTNVLYLLTISVAFSTRENQVSYQWVQKDIKSL